jgi:hypothetical protein
LTGEAIHQDVALLWWIDGIRHYLFVCLLLKSQYICDHIFDIIVHVAPVVATILDTGRDEIVDRVIAKPFCVPSSLEWESLS